MKCLRVTNIQRGCVYDGPGVRTTVFLKGCSLQCPWCCNPETISFEEQWFIDDVKCLYLNGKASRLCNQCERVLGKRSIHECSFGVAESVSRDYSVDDLLEILTKDYGLFLHSCGGITFSGGEPLLQAETLVSVLSKLKELNIHIAFETALVAKVIDLFAVLPYVDLFIVDLKLQPQMNLRNSSYLNKLRQMLSCLQDKKKCFRMVFVDEVLDEKDFVLRALHSLGINKIELLLCHNLGQNKYLRLSYECVNYSASSKKMASFLDYLVENGIETSKLAI